MADTGSDSVKLDGYEIALSSLDKVYFPECDITKGDLVDYYRRIAELTLPYYRDQPLSMQRFPEGIGADGFFQKDVPDHFPNWIDRVRLSTENGAVTYVIAGNAATLIYLANQGCITPHLSLSRRDKPNHPDRLVFDLDPSDDDFGKVQQAARHLKTLLDALEIECFVQTTGSRGLHVLVPLDRSADFDAAREFARAAAEELVKRHPDSLTVEQRKDKRRDRVFLDYLRNAYGQTAVAPYAVRAKEEAPVATPLRWDEAFSSALTPRKYTITNLFRRLGQTTDPFSGMARHACSVKAMQKRLLQLF